MLANRGRARIRAPRRGLNQNDVDLENTWANLSNSFRQIHTKNASQLSYEELFRLAYRVVLQKKGDVLYNRVRDFENEWLEGTVRPKILDYLTGSLVSPASAVVNVSERRTAGERFLKGLKAEWLDHKLCMAMLSDVLMYMDRVYCTDHSLPNIFDISMALFRDHILKAKTAGETEPSSIMDVLNSVILEQVQMERDGDVIDKNAVKACTHMLAELDVDQPEVEYQQLYTVFFEPQYLAASREFYQKEADRLLQEYDAGSYCRQTLKRINEEAERCRSLLFETTEKKIEKVVEEELIQKKLHDLIEMESGVRFMIDNDRLDDLEVVFDLNARVDSKKLELTKAVQRRVVEMGNEVNKSVALAAQAPPAPANDANGEKPKERPKGPPLNQQTVAAIKWVDEILELKDKFDKFWRQSFRSDQTLQTALTRSFTDFINSSTFNRGSEYISLFIDDNMRKGIKNKTEAEVDQVLDKAITLLRYVQDKDLFERYYKKHLSRRLLMNKSLSLDSEKSMISRMKIELGNNFTAKLEAMFKDMSISEDLTRGYKDHVSKLGDADPSRVELRIDVLTAMTWPLDNVINATDDDTRNHSKVIYPPSIQRVKQGFEKFYSDKHSGRKLTWQPQMGTADLKARLWRPDGKGGKNQRTFEYNVSTYAMLILLLFNDLGQGESLSFEEIQAQTNIPTNDLIRNLQSLAVAQYPRILTKDPMSRDVNPTDCFLFNDKFQPKSQKVKVGVVLAQNKVETDRERLETEKKNDDNRQFCIEAAIVRIMKQRKQLEHTKLIAETISQLTHQFKPDVSMIKHRVESLIEREYLERVEDAQPAAYKYLA